MSLLLRDQEMREEGRIEGREEGLVAGREEVRHAMIMKMHQRITHLSLHRGYLRNSNYI